MPSLGEPKLSRRTDMVDAPARRVDQRHAMENMRWSFAYKAECGGRDRSRSQARGEKAKAARPVAAEAN